MFCGKLGILPITLFKIVVFELQLTGFGFLFFEVTLYAAFKFVTKRYTPINSKLQHPSSRYLASLDGQMPHPLELQGGSNPLFKCTYSVTNNWLLFGSTIDQNRKAVVVLGHTFTNEKDKQLIQRIIYVNKDDGQKKEKL